MFLGKREEEGGRGREREGEGGRGRDREGQGGRGRDREGQGGRGRDRDKNRKSETHFSSLLTFLPGP